MKKSIKFLSAAVLGIAAVACSSPEKMAEMAENVTVNCEPAVLEVVAGKIDATVSVTYPADYFHPKAILEVTPVIVYEGGEAKMAPFVYQGEDVTENYKTIPSEGSTVTEKVSFDYVPGMEKCYLELRGVVKYKKKAVDVPTRKVADGANTTYMLVNKAGKADYKADNYQAVIKQTAEGQILYTINSSVVRNNQLKSESIKNFQAALDEIKANGRKEITSTDIVAYASPDGGEELNAKLSGKRSETAEKAFGKVTKVFTSAYGLINYASDILSYARLYGLMLSGAQIASIFTNTLAIQMLFPAGAAGVVFPGISSPPEGGMEEIQPF